MRQPSHNMKYNFTPTFPRVGVAAYMRFDVEEDYDPRYGMESMQHYVTMHDLAVEQPDHLAKNLWHGQRISIRAVANNLDGDDRSGINELEDRVCFGEMVRIASLSLALDYLDEPESCPLEYRHLLVDLDQYDLQEDMEQSLNYLTDVTEPKVSAYLFGRNYTREAKRDVSDLMDQFWMASNEIIWTCLSHLKSLVPELMDIFEILYTSEGYLAGKWENDYLSLYLITESGKELPRRFNFRG